MKAPVGLGGDGNCSGLGRGALGAALAAAVVFAAPWTCPAQGREAAADAPPALQKYLTNPRFDWNCRKTARFRFCYPARLAGAPEVAYLGERVQQKLAATLRTANAGRYRPVVWVFIVESFREMQELVGSYAGGASLPQAHAIFVAIGDPASLGHELNHEVLTTLWGPSEPWIAEGFAAYAEDGTRVDAQCRELAAQGKLMPLDSMVNSYWSAAMYPATVTYPELGSFIQYLRRTYGLARLRQVWRGGSDSIARVFQKPLGELERDWLAAIRG